MNELRLTLLRHYGKLSGTASSLGVQPAAVKSWLDASHRNMLKHLPELRTQTGLTYEEIVDLVLERESELLNVEE